MEEFLVGSLKNTWPYFLLAFVVCELLLLTRERKGLVLEIILGLIICITFTVQGQYQSHSVWAAENRPVLLATANLLSVLMPLVVFVVANQFLVNIQSTRKKHAILIAVVLVTMFVWPLWIMYVTCATGLDCL